MQSFVKIKPTRNGDETIMSFTNHIVSEYDQEIPQSHTADQPSASCI